LSTSAIAKRYAKALVGIAAEQQTVEQYGSELGKVCEAFGVEEYLRLILESPTFPLEKKGAILKDLMEMLEISPGMQGFLGLLLEKDRIQYLGQINRDYSQLADDLAGVVRAAVTSSRDLDGKQQEAIKAGLEQQTGKQVELSVAVDEELIGGLQVEIGGRLFDGSLKTQLKRIEDTLKKG